MTKIVKQVHRADYIITVITTYNTPPLPKIVSKFQPHHLLPHLQYRLPQHKCKSHSSPTPFHPQFQKSIIPHFRVINMRNWKKYLAKKLVETALSLPTLKKYLQPSTVHSMNLHGVDNQFGEYYHNMSQSCHNDL